MATAVEVLVELFPGLRDRVGAGAQDAGGYLACEVLEDLVGVFGGRIIRTMPVLVALTRIVPSGVSWSS